MDARPATRRWWPILTLLLLLAFSLRVWNLTDAPPGLTHDEASNGHDSAAILRGVHRIYFPVGYGHEPLYDYSAAVTTALLGQSTFALRLTTVFWSGAQLVLVIALARRWWGRRAALAAAACYAVSFWALMLARVGLRAPTLPALLAGSALAFDHAQTRARSRLRLYALSGLLLGASFYTYMASRGMPLLYVVFVVALWLTHPAERGRVKSIAAGTLLLLAIAAAVGAPLFLYLHAHPELELRIAQLGSALTALRGGDLQPLLQNVRDGLPMLLWRGDPFWLYNIAGRPGLEPWLALGFVVGLLYSLARLRDRRNLFVLIWLAGGVAPALIAPVAYNLLHAVAAMPPVFLIAAHGFSAAAGWLEARIGDRRPQIRTALAAAAGAAFAITGGLTARAYFGTWAQNRDVRVAYHQHVAALARYLDRDTAIDPVNDTLVLTSLYPGEFHDPYAMEVALRRDDLSLRWADARGALFVPATPAWLFVESQTSPAGLLWDALAPDVALDTVLTFRATDLSPRTTGYRWNAPATWAGLVPTLDTAIGLQGDDPPTAEVQVATRAPVTFGTPAAATVSLVGYRLLRQPDGTFTLLTAWDVLAPTRREWVIFTHLLDVEGHLLAQDDRLDAPSWQWRAGDRFVQIHHLPAADGAPVAIALGLYTRDDLSRMTVDAGSLVGSGPVTRVLLPLGGG